MMELVQSGISDLMYLIMMGSVQRLSTGTSKKPWIWEAWRSMVMTWSQPATWSMLATSLQVMGALDLSFLSMRE